MASPAHACEQRPSRAAALQPPPQAELGLALLAALALMLSASAAAAHSWYEADCCSGRDCAPIPVEAVGYDANGDYLITIKAGSHPLVQQTQVWHWPRSEARQSQDGYWHGCVSFAKDLTGHQRLLCLYAPMSF